MADRYRRWHHPTSLQGARGHVVGQNVDIGHHQFGPGKDSCVDALHHIAPQQLFLGNLARQELVLKESLFARHLIGFIHIPLSQGCDAGDHASDLELGCDGLENVQNVALR